MEAAVIENLRLPQGDPWQFATPDMMLGKGHFSDPQAQMRLHTAILQQSQKLARETFHAAADMGLPIPSYTAVRQESKESFMSFLDRLRDAPDWVPGMSPEVKNALGMQLSVENANPTRKRILQTLPRTVTLVDMIDACSRVGTTEGKTTHLAEAMAAALKLLVQHKRGNTSQ